MTRILGAGDEAALERFLAPRAALDELRVPPPLADGRWTCRVQRADDTERLAYLSLGFEIVGDYGLVLLAA